MTLSTCNSCLHTTPMEVSICPLCLNNVGDGLTKKPKVSHDENKSSKSHDDSNHLNWMALPFKTPPFASMTATLVAAGYLIVPPSGVAAGYAVIPPSGMKPPTFLGSMDNVRTLESICKPEKGSSKKRKAEIAQMLDAVFKHVMSKTKYTSHHAAACVAVYKLAIVLGKIQGNEEIKASEWRRLLENRYGVIISCGIAKYNIGKSKSNVFQNAVVDAYNFISNDYPLWVNEKNLPAIYRQLIIVQNMQKH